jgi:hypothetical protein
MNRVQFQKGRSMTEFNALYGNEDACRAAGDAHAGHTACPRCQHRGCRRSERGGQLYLECTACGRQTSLIRSTLFQASKLPLRLLFLAMHLLSAAKIKLSALELREPLIDSEVPLGQERSLGQRRAREHQALAVRRVPLDPAEEVRQALSGRSQVASQLALGPNALLPRLTEAKLAYGPHSERPLRKAPNYAC